MSSLPSVTSLVDKLAALGIELPSGRLTVGGYGDSEALSQELIDLIRSGKKRAGTGLLMAYELEAEPVPAEGDVEIVINYLSEPVLITRLTSVQVVPFCEVTAAYAAVEGEGDGSLEYWRKGHWEFFGRECKRLGLEPSQEMLVVCSVFEVLNAVPTSAV